MKIDKVITDPENELLKSQYNNNIIGKQLSPSNNNEPPPQIIYHKNG